MSTATLGLRAAQNLTGPAAFLAWNWFYAYGVLSSRTPKQIYGLDHNANPRADLTKYGNEAVKSGKITQAQLDQLRRFESASANAVEGYTLFVASVLFGIIAGVHEDTIFNSCSVYTVARLIYGAVYVFVANDTWSQARGIAWWTGNGACLFLLAKGGRIGGL